MANEYFHRTPTSTGNRSVYTISVWIKKQGIEKSLLDLSFLGSGDGTTYAIAGTGAFGSTYNNRAFVRNGGSNTGYFDRLFRDLGAWTNFLWSVDTTQSGGGNRIKLYVNGADVGELSADIALNTLTNINTTNIHSIGTFNLSAGPGYTSGYDTSANYSDYFFVDGQALTPDVFGFYKEGKGYESSGTAQATDFRPGQWSPHSPRKIKTEIERRGGFGVNGFYLPMNDSSNFGADFHTTPNSIIKLKGEDLPQPRNGAPTTTDAYVSQLREDPYAANLVLAVPGISTATGSNLVTNGTFDSDVSGWGVSGGTFTWNNGRAQHVTGSNAPVYQQITGLTIGQRYTFQYTHHSGYTSAYISTNTVSSGSILHLGDTISSSTIVKRGSFTATATSHYVVIYGIGSNTSIWDNVVVKQEDAPRDYSADIKGSGSNKTLTPSGSAGVGYELGNYYGSAMSFDGSGDYLETTLSAFGTTDFTIEYWINPDSISGSYVGTVRLQATTNTKRIEQAFQNSTLQIYTDTGAWRDTGFAPPTKQWTHIALEKYNGYLILYANGVAVWTVTNTVDYDESFNVDIGSHVNSLDGYMQDVRVYSGVAKYKGGFDVPKPYTPVGFEGESWRQVSDTCKNNFATLNPNFGVGRQDQQTYTNGNLRVVSSATSGSDTTAPSTIAIKGKIYCEFALTDDGLGAYVGVMKYNTSLTNNGIDTTASSDCWLIRGDNEHKSNGDGGGGASYGTGTWSTGDIIMMAVDIDNTSIWFGKNGTWYASGDPAANSNAAYTNLPSTDDLLTMCGDNYSSETPTIDVNFGQNPTFSGQITAGTFADGNGKGLFKYQPPSGFLALCEDNLPTPAIADPGDYLKTVLYEGDNISNGVGRRAVRGVGFKPDLVWIKCRDQAQNHVLYDSVRGLQCLNPNDTAVESTFDSQILGGYDEDGFTTSPNNDSNYNGQSFVAWCWKAGGSSNTFNVDGTGYATASAAGITDGSIALTGASVNQEAGFSIVSYTSTGSAGTVGHGLGKKPKVVLIKRRTGASTNWPMWFDGVSTNTDKVLQLNLLNPEAAAAVFFNSGDTTTTTFPLGSGGGQTNDSDGNSDSYIAYVWAEIPGFSKFGSYVGNGDADGPMVVCGFKPAWVMVKNIDDTGGRDWGIQDSSRQPINPCDKHLKANQTEVENSGLAGSTYQIDMLSNGFKVRNNTGIWNNSGETIIFMAFAESPFQTANAK